MIPRASAQLAKQSSAGNLVTATSATDALRNLIIIANGSTTVLALAITKYFSFIFALFCCTSSISPDFVLWPWLEKE